MKDLIKFFTFFLPVLFFAQKNTAEKVDEFNLRALSICKQADKELFCRSYHFYLNKEFDSCYIASSKALLISKKTEEKDLLNHFLSISARKKKLHKKALQSSLAISNDSLFINRKNNSLGYCYLQLKDYEKSIFHFEKWLNNSTNETDEKKHIVLHNLGIIHNILNNNDEATRYLEQELELLKNKTDTLVQLNSLQALANLYYGQYKDKEAIPLFIEAYKLAKSYSDFKWKHVTSENMAIVEKNRNNFEASIKYFEEARNWKDSIYNQDRIWELTQKEKEIAIAQKELEIALEKEKNRIQEIQKNGFILGTLFLFIIVLFLIYFYKQRTTQNKIITAQKDALNTSNKTKDYLFSVVSHDLRSPINTLNKLHKRLQRHIKNNNLEEIENTNNSAVFLTENTTKLLNNILNWSLQQSNQMVFAPTEYPLHKLVEHVVYDFNGMASAKKINLQTKLDEHTITTDVESLKITLRNLVDNAIKYTNDEGEITVTCGITESKKSFISIQDNGIGISKEAQDKINDLHDLSVDKINRAQGIGLGMILCQTLIKQNKGQLIIESTLDKGSKFTILLP